MQHMFDNSLFSALPYPNLSSDRGVNVNQCMSAGLTSSENPQNQICLYPNV